MLNAATNYTIGIPNQDLSSVLSHFYQVDVTTETAASAKMIEVILLSNESKQPLNRFAQNENRMTRMDVALSLPKQLSEAGSTKGILAEVFLKKLNKIFEEHHENAELTVNQIAKLMQLSYIQFVRKLKKITNQTPARSLRQFRLEKAKTLLQNPMNALNVSETAYQVGFTDPNYFSRSFGAFFGQSPNTYRLQNAI